MKKGFVAILIVVMMLPFPAVSFAEEASFLWEIDIPGVIPFGQVMDGSFYIGLPPSAEEDVWIDVEYNCSEIGDCSIVSSRFNLFPGMTRSVASFILFPEQSGYFAATVVVEGGETIVFKKWIMVDSDPGSVLEVEAWSDFGTIVVQIAGSPETDPEGIWAVIRKADEPFSGPVPISWTPPGGFFQTTLLIDKALPLRGSNVIEFSLGESYVVQLWREGDDGGPPYLAGQPVIEKRFSILSLKKIFFPLVVK